MAARKGISVDRALMAGIILLTLGTALTHIYLGSFGLPLFVLNGLGYIGLAAALYLPLSRVSPYRGIVRWVLIGYTALTIVLWFAIAFPTPLGYVNKVNEAALIALLLLEHRLSRR